MNAEVTYALYEVPSRWSRLFVIASAIAVVILALWILVPIAMSRFAPATAAHSKADIHIAPKSDSMATQRSERPAQTSVAATNSVRTITYERANTVTPLAKNDSSDAAVATIP